MSNLRPDDRGMDAVTCIKLYFTHHVPTIDENQMPLIATDFNDVGAYISNEDTIDLGAVFAVRSTEEQKAECRARAHENVTEASALSSDHLQTNSAQEVDNADIGVHSSSDVIDGTEATAEEVTTSEDPEGEENFDFEMEDSEREEDFVMMEEDPEMEEEE